MRSSTQTHKIYNINWNLEYSLRLWKKYLVLQSLLLVFYELYCRNKKNYYYIEVLRTQQFSVSSLTNFSIKLFDATIYTSQLFITEHILNIFKFRNTVHSRYELTSLLEIYSKEKCYTSQWYIFNNNKIINNQKFHNFGNKTLVIKMISIMGLQIS